MIRIFGTMTDPTGVGVPGALIELRAIKSQMESLYGSTVAIKCNAVGAYDFKLAPGTYDVYAQNDLCGDMDYLGIGKVSSNTPPGSLNAILVDGGIDLTPPMLDAAIEARDAAQLAKQQAVASAKSADEFQKSAGLSADAAQRSTELTSTDRAAAAASAGLASKSAGEAASAKESAAEAARVAGEHRAASEQLAAAAAGDAHRAEVAKGGSEQASSAAELSASVASQKEASALASAAAAGQSAVLSEQHSAAAGNSATLAGDEAAKAKVQADSAIATEQRIQQAAAGQLDSIATEGAKQIALAKSHADKGALSQQASSESATRSESAAQRAEELVDQATGGALLKDQNLGDVPNKEVARTNLDVPSKSQLEQAINGITPASIGARPDSWTPTAYDVGARGHTWLPSLEEIGAASSGSVAALQPAGSASFVYEDGLLTKMTEQLPTGVRVTAYSYTEGQLTKAVETQGQLFRTTTFTYQAGILTGYTTTETVT
ncbi:carboxypeptidase-like regulatory domain-containing protein [Aeromonas salmonicida]|uniref:carboxypeptidase-like regulatory domain-containing protein n=1 Tax=Aeromonas salmonicida TaxID=645 RepID=UPI001BACA1F7|nr:carboxypeptidase-like regulatory domain-containing protein [Aeromonas salmonicida]MBS2781741.1 carboxypeptidase regulatory-like domain-containing protein [Aeromonas salmonicida]